MSTDQSSDDPFHEPSFRNPDHQETFARDGFLATGFRLTADELAAADEFYATHEHHYADERYASTLALPYDVEHRIEADALFGRLTRRLVSSSLLDYQQYYGGFGVKNPSGDRAVLDLHQDLTMVPYDARRTGITLWIPLCDTDETNGCLHVLPGSHLVNRNPRAVGMPFAYRDHADTIRERLLVPLPAARGQAIFMDQALIHYSGPNHGTRVRVAMMGMLHGAQDGLVYYHRVREGDGYALQRYAVPSDFYLRQPLGHRPYTGVRVGTVPMAVAPYPVVDGLRPS